jgi:hypothetical protein
MNQIRFKSVLNPDKYGYVWTNDSMSYWEQAYRARMPLAGDAGWFETLGDGFTQHTPDTVVCAPLFTDYCVSLAQYLLDNPAEEIRLSELEDKGEGAAMRARFLATIQYRDDKRQYFHLTENKVTTSQSKAYDKRWLLVPTYANATKASAMSLLFEERKSSLHLLELYAWHSFYWDTLYACADNGDWHERTVKYQEEISSDHAAAFKALQGCIQAREKLWLARRNLSCAIHNSTLAIQEVA